MGKDWHRACLKCAKCGKTLSAGSHSEVGGGRLVELGEVRGGVVYGGCALSQSLSLQHEGKPYCNHPCYSAMFGPKGML